MSLGVVVRRAASSICSHGRFERLTQVQGECIGDTIADAETSVRGFHAAPSVLPTVAAESLQICQEAALRQ
jgi:hypothetical protein